VVQPVFYLNNLPAAAIPLAMKAHDGIIIPSAFAIATGLPVILASIILSQSLTQLGHYIGKMQQIEKWTRKTAAIIFILAGT